MFRIERVQDLLIRLLGNRVEGRAALVSAMLHRDASEATSYWLQLVVATGIATLGLVVGSTAVVIGAMLVAPLMGPIIGLAMGLAAGSPFLVLRSGFRIAISVLVAVAGAASITVLLPFHELNTELLARTSPTALDLITAAFCALAGVYASLRPGSDTASTAAGTSIGISLVPPLCACGYGVGTLAWPVARGAALLFVTNMVAIVVVGTVAFLAAGFNRVDVLALEHEELGSEGRDASVARAMTKRLWSLFESRFGPALRILMPFALLGALYLPLRRALDEVAWEVRVRTLVRDSIAREPSRVVQSRVRVEHHSVEVVLVVLGTTGDATTAHARLEREIREGSNVTPRIEVLAVPDAGAFAGLESTLVEPRFTEAKPPEPPPSAGDQLDEARSRVKAAVTSLWPSASAGQLLGIEIDAAVKRPVRIRVIHIGAELGAGGIETLGRALGGELGLETELVDVAVPASAMTRDLGDLKLVAEVASAVRATRGIPDVRACVARPKPPKASRKGAARDDEELARMLDEALGAHARVTTTSGETWSIRFVTGECSVP